MQTQPNSLLEISKLLERELLLLEWSEEGRRLKDPRRTRNLGKMFVEETINFLFNGVNGDVLYCGFKHFVFAVVPSFLGEIAI